MNIIKHIITISISIILFSFLINTAQAAGDPIALLQSISNNMITGLKANKATLKTNPQVVYKLAYRYVVPYASLPEMSRRVLPPQIWSTATPAQRAQFQKEFTRTLVRTYASALTSYSDQTIKFYPIRGNYQNASSVVVNSQIVSSETQPIQVSYRLLRIGGSWKLYDLSVEGVSMLESFRSQFASILSQGNMAQLLQKMSAHNSR